MSLTIDCGEGKHGICRGWGTHHYLIPQMDDGQEFECACPCHKRGLAEPEARGTRAPAETSAAVPPDSGSANPSGGRLLKMMEAE